jgi:hypothetical protein
MRLAALVFVIALFAAACTAGPELVVTGTEGGIDEAPAEAVATPLPVSDVPDKTATEPKPEPRPTPDRVDDIAVLPVDDPPPLGPAKPADWRDHPLAAYVPDASEIGADWTITDTKVTEYGEPEPDEDLAACGITEPPTLDGIEVIYIVGFEYYNTVTFVVNRGPEAVAQSFVDVFRALPGCNPEAIGFFGGDVEITTETLTVDGADDAVVSRYVGTLDDVDVQGTFLVVRFGELVLAMGTGSYGGANPSIGLSVDQVLEIIERAAERG